MPSYGVFFLPNIPFLKMSLAWLIIPPGEFASKAPLSKSSVHTKFLNISLV